MNSLARMSHSPLIFWEKAGRWAAAWRQIVHRKPSLEGGAGAGVRIVETRLEADCREALQAWPAAFVALELARANREQVLALLWHAAQWHSRARAAVLAEREMAHYEPLCCELSAVHFVTSTRQLDSLARCVRAHLAGSAPADQDPREEVWSRLPWSV